MLGSKVGRPSGVRQAGGETVGDVPLNLMVCLPGELANPESRNQQIPRKLKRAASPASKEEGKREKLSGMDRAEVKGTGKDLRKSTGGSVELGDGRGLVSRL